MIRKFICAFTVVCTAAMSCNHASAQSTPSAGCLVAPARLSDSQITTFLQAPQQLLLDYTQGGLPLASQVRGLVGSSADALDPIFRLVPSASVEQLAGLGAGLARAARACAAANPEYALQIQERVLELNDASMLTAFLGASNEIQTAALGGATSGGAAAAGIGAGGVAGGGAGGGDGSEATTTSSGDFGVSRGSRYFSSSVSISAVSPN